MKIRICFVKLPLNFLTCAPKKRNLKRSEASPYGCQKFEVPKVESTPKIHLFEIVEKKLPQIALIITDLIFILICESVANFIFTTFRSGLKVVAK